jgi:hypothetical protein
MPPNNMLQKQLENERFEHALNYVQKESLGIKNLTTAELGQLNQMLTGDQDSPWRFNEITITIPTGTIKKIAVIQNPVIKARDILSTATHLLQNDSALSCAYYVYRELVLSHVFNDANRRTAVLATIWFLNSVQINVDARQLLKIPIGDIQDISHSSEFKNKLDMLISSAHHV